VKLESEHHFVLSVRSHRDVIEVGLDMGRIAGSM
jgi:hypothetical protein